MRSAGRALLLLLCLAAVLPATALAHRPATIAPPGDSAITQYVEDIPTDQGETPTQPGYGSARATLPAGLAGRSARGAVTARDLAVIVAATAPVANGGVTRPSARRVRTRGDGRGRPAEAATGQSGGGPGLSPAAARSPALLLTDAVTGGSGLGVLIATGLLASLAGAVAVRLRRGRQRP